MVLRAVSIWALAAAAFAGLATPLELPYASDKMIQIPLMRHTISHQWDHRALRLQHQQERIRRRLMPDHGPNGTAGVAHANETVGTIVFNQVPLGVGFGTHYAELYLGIPTQKASVIVDTGSHLTALPCSSCKDCGKHTDPLFDVAKSTTAKYVTCNQYVGCMSCEEQKCYISQSYTEGSMWSAVVVDDLVWLGGMSDKHPERFLKNYGVRFPVGCQTKETGLFITQKENGIMGFGRDKATLMSYMVAQKRVEHDVFAMCFSASGGQLVMGGIDYSHHRTKVAYSPLIGGEGGWYPVKVKDVLVGDQTLGVSADKYNTGKGVIVDSGTTDTFFVSTAERAFNRIFSDLAGIDYSDDVMHVSASTLSSLPNITIVLEGADKEGDIMLEIPASKYLTKADDGSYYGNFHFSERSGGVLGASTMVGYDVIFDMEKKRIGFAESSCDVAAFKSKTFAPPSEPKKITEPTIEKETNATGSTNSSTSGASVSSGGSNSSSSSGSFFGQILLVSIVGVVAVVGFKRLRKLKTSWVPLSETDTGCDSLSRAEILRDINDPNDGATRQSVTSPPRRQAAAASSPTQTQSPDTAAQRVPSPRFTIGSDSESEHGDSPRATTEL